MRTDRKTNQNPRCLRQGIKPDSCAYSACPQAVSRGAAPPARGFKPSGGYGKAYLLTVKKCAILCGV
jgi:hypothetical protein